MRHMSFLPEKADSVTLRGVLAKHTALRRSTTHGVTGQRGVLKQQIDKNDDN